MHLTCDLASITLFSINFSAGKSHFSEIGLGCWADGRVVAGRLHAGGGASPGPGARRSRRPSHKSVMGGTVSVCGDLKAKGNEHFKQGRYQEATEAYTLVYVCSIFLFRKVS